MFTLFLESLTTYLVLVWRTFADSRWRPSFRAGIVMVGFLPLFALAQAVHWLGFLMDECLFRNYRQIPVRRPVFVLGPPRSGTTLVHRILARDKQFTTLRTWECLLAPSITERRIYLALGRVDRRFGGYLSRGVEKLTRRLTANLDAVHAVGLDAPEEDYLTLTPILACFILVLPFPFSETLWRLGLFDRDTPAPRRERILAFYRANLQRHLYVHGPEKRLLSKNASFGAWSSALGETFPDARYICCMRDPLETLPSQLSAVRSGVILFDSTRGAEAHLTERFTEVLAFHYENLLRVFGPMSCERRAFVPMDLLVERLQGTLADAYRAIGLPLSEAFDEVLREEDAANRRYRSSHHYDLADTGLGIEAVRSRFASYYAWHENGPLRSQLSDDSPGKQPTCHRACTSAIEVGNP